MSAAADLPCLRVYADEMRVALMRAVLLAGLVAPGGGCTKHDAPAPNPVATASAPTVPSSAPAPVEDGVRLAVYAFGAGGPLPVDDKGNVYSTVYLTIASKRPTLHVELQSLELRDASGARVASMVSPGTMMRDNRPFDDNLPDGGTAQLWCSARMDTPYTALRKAAATRFAAVVVVAGERRTVEGAIAVPTATG